MEKKKLNQEMQQKAKKVRGVYDFLNQAIPSNGTAIDPLDLETLDSNIVALEKGADDLKKIREELALLFMEHFTGKRPTTPQEEKEEEEYCAAAEEPVEEPDIKFQQQTTRDTYTEDINNLRDRDHMIMETLRTGFDLIKGIGRLIGMVKDIKNSR